MNSLYRTFLALASLHRSTWSWSSCPSPHLGHAVSAWESFCTSCTRMFPPMYHCNHIVLLSFIQCFQCCTGARHVNGVPCSMAPTSQLLKKPPKVSSQNVKTNRLSVLSGHTLTINQHTHFGCWDKLRLFTNSSWSTFLVYECSGKLMNKFVCSCAYH